MVNYAERLLEICKKECKAMKHTAQTHRVLLLTGLSLGHLLHTLA